MTEHPSPGNKSERGDSSNYRVSMLENSHNFGIYGGNFIVTNDSSNVTLHLQKIRDWLQAPDCSTNLNTAANKKTAGTGKWIVEHPKYIEWKNNGGLLWIQGKGKLS
ncbi:hypothetical protein BT96DRAFT_982206 [Gymnopus androsaceus JB14]|uniref:Uncharacterized protein n=1 Tax=Gymnopus androsaceus JB14 TaxID=1447944 RepID=A0A6A4GH33_9AGAR|nr:hypothetical protein BT96DRAFT_982206 [Gymnopus androsaceus JB14]